MRRVPSVGNVSPRPGPGPAAGVGPLRRSALVALVLLSGASAALAVGTRAFRQTTAKDFEEGEATGSTILPTGEVATGLVAERLAVDAAFVWCAVAARDGGRAFFGTGDDGKLWELGKGAGKPRLLAKLEAPWITALAERPDGNLVAGTTPGGQLYLVDGKSGAVKPFARVEAEHVWALAQDDRTGTLYVATGTPGKVFAVDGAGKARELWDSGDKHVVALVRDTDGTLLAGTSEEAILYRLRTDGRAEALHDFEADEVRAITRVGGSLVVAVNDFESSGSSPPPTGGPAAAKGTKIVLSQGGPPASAGGLPRPGAQKAKAGLYRLEADGRIEQIHALPDGYYTALLPEDGAVLASSASQGKVYRVSLADRTAAVALDLPERQALALLRSGDDLLVGAGDVGGVFRARPARDAEATYLSKVFDAESPAQWGLLRWHGSKGLGFETRSGATAKPDRTWNPWQALTAPVQSGDEGTGRLASPAGRYVQIRATLGARGVLRDLTLYFQPHNQRARVTELAVGDPPPAAGAVAGSATRSHQSVAKLRWKVENPDGDDLVYRLSYRADGEAAWRPLAGPDPLGKAEYDWNTESVPDGLYEVRVVTSDERANPRERALESVFIAPPLLVDNRKPEVVNVDVRFPVVAGRARDDGSPITQIDFQLDGGDWQPVAPGDRVFDDRVEPFSFKLPALAPGPHVLVIRAWDAADNVGATQITVRAK